MSAVLEEERGQVPSLSYTATRERERESRRGERERARDGGRREGGRESVREREEESGRRTNALGEEGERVSRREPTMHSADVLTFASHLQREKQEAVT